MFKRLLVLAPHTDDGEIGCGGTIAKFLEEGKEVHYVAFSTARTSVRPEFPSNILEIEVREATGILGIPSEHLHILDFPTREFPKCRQEILQHLIELRQELSPDLVFLPSPNHIHQDHHVVAAEAQRAFKSHTVLGYEEPWNNIVFPTRCFICLEPRHIDLKIKALCAYKSQSHRTYLNEDFVRSLARTRGTQIEGRYAEAFEVLRWVIK